MATKTKTKMKIEPKTTAKAPEKSEVIVQNATAKKLLSKTSKLDNRNSSMDIVRVVAVFFVVSIHFFLNNGFYAEKHIGVNMFIMCTMRTFFATCIPLFLMLTGYLMSKKALCKKYYLGLVRILLIYVISGIACVLFKIHYLYLDVDFKTAIIELFNYTLAPYGWYIELYIGLFLLIPFLNILYNGIDSQKHKKALLITFFVLTILPSVINIFSLAENEVWYNPISTDNITKILPNWWVGFYPLTFYFIGCYIREYGLKIKNSVAIILLVLSIFAFGGFNFFRSYNTTFESGQYIAWQGIEPFVMSVLLFVLLSRINADKMPKWLRWIFWKMSDATLGIYLLSYIFDTIAYQILLNSVPVMTDRLKYYFVIVPAVFVCSLVASLLLNLLLKLIDFAIEEIKGVFATLKA